MPSFALLSANIPSPEPPPCAYILYIQVQSKRKGRVLDLIEWMNNHPTFVLPVLSNNLFTVLCFRAGYTIEGTWSRMSAGSR
jgi:hypothetical protein